MMEEKNPKATAGGGEAEPLRCPKCASETRTIDQKKRGIIYLIAGTALFAFTFAIARETIVPYLTIAYFLIIATPLLLKKERFVHVCRKCGAKVSTTSQTPPR